MYPTRKTLEELRPLLVWYDWEEAESARRDLVLDRSLQVNSVMDTQSQMRLQREREVVAVRVGRTERKGKMGAGVNKLVRREEGKSK